MQRFTAGSLTLLSLLLLCSLPFKALADPPGEGSGMRGRPLDDCQKKFAETLQFMDREREYRADKVRYQTLVAQRCAGRQWYEPGLLECALFVPFFGLILPFFGVMLLERLDAVRRKPAESLRE